MNLTGTVEMVAGHRDPNREYHKQPFLLGYIYTIKDANDNTLDTLNTHTRSILYPDLQSCQKAMLETLEELQKQE